MVHTAVGPTAFVAGLMFFLGGERVYILIEIFTGLALIIFPLALAFLIFYYLTRPEVREKRGLSSQRDKIQKEVENAQQDLVSALQIVRTINDRYREQQEQAQEDFKALSIEIQDKIDDLQIAQEKELDAELALLQKLHLEDGLKDVPLDQAQLPGVGPMLAEKLEMSGIQTALDNTPEAIKAIPGFGESKALSLLRWRESFEYQLLNSQPKQLPDQTHDAIVEKYLQQVMTLQAEMSTAQTSLAQRVEELRAKESQELAIAQRTEISAHQTISSLEAHKQTIQEQLDQYGQITFLRLFLAILSAGQEHWQKRIGAYLWLYGFFHPWDCQYRNLDRDPDLILC